MDGTLYHYTVISSLNFVFYCIFCDNFQAVKVVEDVAAAVSQVKEKVEKLRVAKEVTTKVDYLRTN